MKKNIIIGLLVMFSFSSFAQNQLVMDANASLRELTQGFDKIAVSSTIKLIISQGTQIALAVSASDEKYKEEIKTIVKNGTLHIYTAGSTKWSRRSRNNIVYLSFKDISSLKASEASEVIILDTLSLKSFDVSLSGASRFSATFNAEQLQFDLSGASKATCSGYVKKISINCSGASDMNGFLLYADTAALDASGASDINIYVIKDLNAEASGASHISYKGKPEVANVKSSGVSKIMNQ